MYCYQCEETVGPCSRAGVCGKDAAVAGLQDDLIYLVKRIARDSEPSKEAERFITKSLFTTITNVNFSASDIRKRIEEGLRFTQLSMDDLRAGSGIEKEEDEDARSLKETLTYGLKGMAAYLHHAEALGHEDSSIHAFIREALAATLEAKTADELVALVLKCGEYGIKAMALLDRANTERFGNPVPTQVKTGVRENPAILVSGHDLLDLKELLEQTRGTGVDVYTHGEMLPANSYPELKRYDHLIGNYGGSWWHQAEEFERFKGPILMTTNCIVPPRDSYKDRIFTTDVVSFDGVKHIPDRKEGGTKDFSEIIELAKGLPPPESLEEGSIMGGFAHASVLSVAERIIEAVKSGRIRRFIVMAGCDGRHRERQYYTDFAKALPEDTIILTAGCAKYRYNKLGLGEIDGIPRVIDAGQCNDSYSLVVIAQKLAEAFGLDDINKLPISFNIAWYEQKAVLVLLALLHLGVKGIRLGPRLPAFVSPNVLKVLVDRFGIAGITDVESDLKALVPD